MTSIISVTGPIVAVPVLNGQLAKQEAEIPEGDYELGQIGELQSEKVILRRLGERRQQFIVQGSTLRTARAMGWVKKLPERSQDSPPDNHLSEKMVPSRLGPLMGHIYKLKKVVFRGETYDASFSGSGRFLKLTKDGREQIFPVDSFSDYYLTNDKSAVEIIESSEPRMQVHEAVNKMLDGKISVNEAVSLVERKPKRDPEKARAAKNSAARGRRAWKDYNATTDYWRTTSDGHKIGFKGSPGKGRPVAGSPEVIAKLSRKRKKKSAAAAKKKAKAKRYNARAAKRAAKGK